MLHLEWVRLAIENAIINGEHRLHEGGCQVVEDDEARWQPHDYRQGICPASVICLGDYVDGEIHDRAIEKLGVSITWLNSFIHAFDGMHVDRSTDEWQAWSMGAYFRVKYLFKEAYDWNERAYGDESPYDDYEDDDEV